MAYGYEDNHRQFSLVDPGVFGDFRVGVGGDFRIFRDRVADLATGAAIIS